MIKIDNCKDRDFSQNPMTRDEAQETYMRLLEVIREELGTDYLGAHYALRFAAEQMERDIEAMFGPARDERASV